jgi:predicted Ser/Thr protein kinase
MTQPEPPRAPVDHAAETRGPNETPPPPGKRPERAPSASPPRTELPRTFGGYRLLEEIGRGGMGVVYRAQQESLNRVVALKMIRPGAQASEETIRRFCREAQAAGVLDHPNIVPVYEYGELEGQPYFTMAYVPGTNLRDWVKSHGLPGRAECVALMRALADAIDFAHQHGIIHRDLKPENILLVRGRPRIVDFGLAKYFSGGPGLPVETVQGEILGTPVFMAPEQAAGDSNRISPLVDIYSLGGVLYFLLTGRAPFNGPNLEKVLWQVRYNDPTPPRTLNPQADAELEAICLRCLHKDPEQRYQSAAALAADLQRAERGQSAATSASGTTSATTVSVAEGPKPTRRRWPWLLGLAGILFAGGGLAWWFWPAAFTPRRADQPEQRERSETVELIAPEKRLQDFDLEVKLLGGTVGEDGIHRFVAGERARYSIKTNQDAYVGVWSVEADGKIFQVFPTENPPNHLFKAGQERIVPKNGVTTETTVGAGVDRLWVVAVSTFWEPLPSRSGGQYRLFLTEPGREQVLRTERGVRVVDLSEQVLQYHVSKRGP